MRLEMAIETNQTADGPDVDAWPKIGLEDGFRCAKGIRAETGSGRLLAGSLGYMRGVSYSNETWIGCEPWP